MEVTIKQLQVFVQLGESLHFGRAAEALGVAQPTVSQQISRLEKAWGVTLFDRSTQSVRFTSAGAALYTATVDLLRRVDSVNDLARLHRDTHANSLSIVFSPSVGNLLLPRLLQSLDETVPNVGVIEIPAETGRVVDLAQHRDADVAIGRFLEPVPGMRWEKLCDEPLLAVVGERHHVAGQSSVNLRDLEDLPLFLWERSQAPQYHDWLLAVCQQRGLSPLHLVSPSQIVGPRLYLLSQVRAFALVPQSVAQNLPAGLMALHLDRPATIPLEMLYRQDDPRPWMPGVVATVREEARALTTVT